MKILRFLLTSLGVLAALAALLALAAFSPPVQTWVVQFALSRHHVPASVGSVAAGWGDLDVRDLSLDLPGAHLTVPTLSAKLPMVALFRERQARIAALESKGWTLDLTRKKASVGLPETAPTPGPDHAFRASQLKAAIEALASVLGAWRLPLDTTLGSAELEGDVLVPNTGSKEPIKIHVILKGGGLAVGREASFDLDAAVVLNDSEYAADAISAHGKLGLVMGTDRAPLKISLATEISDTSGKIPAGQNAVLTASRGTRPGAEDYDLEVSRKGQSLVSVSAHLDASKQNLSGEWTVGFKDADLAVFTPDHTLPRFEVSGTGRFETDPSFEQVRVIGRVKGTLEDFAQLGSPLELPGTLSAEGSFEAVQKGKSLRIERAELALDGAGSKAVLRALQAFDCDESSGQVAPADGSKDWLEVSVQDFPLEGLKAFTEPFEVSAGRASFAFTLRSTGDGFSLEPKARFTGAGIALGYLGTTLASKLDVSLSMAAGWDGKQWTLRQADLDVAREGIPFAKVSGQASRGAGPDQPVELTGTWAADLDSPSFRRAVPAAARLTARKASGDFSVTWAPVTKVEGKLTVVGHNPVDTFDAAVHAEVYGDGTITFRIPTKLVLGPGESDLSFEGTFSEEASGPRIEMELSAAHASLDHLTPFGALLSAGDASCRPAADAKDSIPFWGRYSGKITLVFDHLAVGQNDCKDVRGALEFENSSLHLKRGRCTLPRHTLENGEATLSFDPSAESPYSLSASASPFSVDSAEFLAPAKGQDAVVEGHFIVAGSVKGSGKNLRDLIDHSQEEYRLSSTGGILRALNTSIADSIPEAPAPVADTLGTVGSAVGSIFGIKSDLGARNPVSKTAEAVIQFTNNVSEVGFDSAKLVVRRGADRTIHISDLALAGPDERLTGSGSIAASPGLGLRDQALSLDLQLWVRGKMAELLSTAGLVSTSKDADGFEKVRKSWREGVEKLLRG